jgi:hypothetical protein
MSDNHCNHCNNALTQVSVLVAAGTLESGL